MKRVLFSILSVLMVLSMVACTGSTDAGSQAASNVSGGTETPSGDLKAAMVTAQKLGDNGVTDSCHEGFVRGCDEFGYKGTVVEVEAGEYEESLRALCEEKYDLIFVCFSALEDACAKVAAEYPDSKFIMVFSSIEVPNVKAIASLQEDGSYLAGVAAAKQFEHIGFVGGSDNQQINLFLSGYHNGAMATNPDVKFDFAWVGSFDDPARAKDIGLMLFDQGVECIYVAAGGSYAGVFEAAKETGKYVIGCDVNQNDFVPGQVIGSMLMNYNNWVYSCFVEAAETGFTPGVFWYGLEHDNLDFAFPEDSMYATPQETKDAVAAAKQGIIDGAITVDKTVVKQ